MDKAEAASNGETNNPVKRKLPAPQRSVTEEDGNPVRSPPLSRRRKESIAGVLGNEGGPLPQPGLHFGKCIGVFTSGGDSQGKLCSGCTSSILCLTLAKI